jgi:hypothetical protein
MALWEYKVISSGKGGFATPALLEKFLNDTGKDQWEIIEFHTAPDNPLAFSGLARRPTQRDWTLEDAAAAAAKTEADKVRAEFEAKFKGMVPAAGGPAENQTATALDEKVAPDDGYRSPVDTSRDQDPDADDDDDEAKDDWDKLVEDDELPTFFEAIRPHMRRNQRGPGTSVGVDYLAKKWGFDEADVIGALKECGFDVPDDENAKPVYIEYDGDLYWVNVNRRGELWINTKEKPRPVFRTVQGQRAVVEEEPAAKPAPREAAASETKPEPATTEAQKAEPLPAGPELLEKIRPKMRRNRHDAGGSGSTSFLSRAFRCGEADLLAAFAGLGLVLPEKSGDKPVTVEIGRELWWLNKDKRGGVWVNGREKKAAEKAPAAEGSAAEPGTTAAAQPPADAASPQPAPEALLAGVRLLLKPTRTGALSGEAGKLAAELGKPEQDFVAALVSAGLKVPEKAREKPVFVEHAEEILWFNKNAKGQLWLNAKASKFTDQSEEGAGKPKRSRSRKKAGAEDVETAPPAE